MGTCLEFGEVFMSFLAKVGLLIAAVIIIFAIALTVVIKTQVTPEKVRTVVLPLAEDQLQRKIDFGEISIGLFSGISIADFRVQEKDAAENFISLKKLDLHYRLWPLLKGQIAVDQVLLVDPVINVIRNQDGSFNFSDLIKGGQQDPPRADPADGKKSDGATVPGVNLLVKELSINNGAVRFVDKFVNPKTPYRYNLEQLNFSARDITLKKSFPLDFSVAINGTDLAISGDYDISAQSGDLIIELMPLDIVQFAPYYRDSLPGKLGAAAISMNLEAGLRSGKLSSKGKLILNDVDLVLDAMRDAPLRKANVRTDYAIEFDLNKRLLAVTTLLVDFNGLAARLEGQVDLAADDPQLEMALKFEQIDLRQAFEQVPQALVKEYRGYSPAGHLSADLHLAGRLSEGPELLQQAYLSLADVRATVGTLRTGISGDLLYHGGVMTSNDLVLSLGEQRLDLDLQARDLFADVVRGEFQIAAVELDLNRLLAQLSSSEDAIATKSQPQMQQPASDVPRSISQELGPFDLPLDMTGTLTVGRMLYKQLPLKQVAAGMTLKNNLLTISNLSANVGSGEMRVASVIDLGVEGLSYQGQMNLQMPDVMTLLRGLIPGFDQQVSGRMQWQNSFSGRGTLPKQLLQVLQMQGEVKLSQGTLQDVPLIETLAGFLGDQGLEVLSYDSFSGSYDLRDGLTSMNTELNSSKVKMAPQGTLGLDGSLDLSLTTKLAPALMARIGSSTVQKALVDEEGWGRLPLRVSGSLISPKIGFDSAALQQQAVERGKEVVTEKLLKKLLPDAKTEEEKEPVQQLLDQTLDKLFGQ
jgi:AsmA protein